jgi:O-antigen/teichoic acid export membrane protein
MSSSADAPPRPVRSSRDDEHGDLSSQIVAYMFGRGLLFVLLLSLQISILTIVSPVLARLLGPVQFGRVALAIALHQVLLVLGIFGLDQSVVLQHVERDGRNRARGLIASAALLASGLTVVADLTGPLWSRTLGFGAYSGLVVVAVLWTMPASVCQVIMAYLRAEERFRPFAVVSLLSSVGGQVCGIGLLFVFGRDATIYAWGGVVAQCASLLFGIAATRPRLAGILDVRTTVRALRLGLPLAMNGLAVFVLNAGDRVVVERDLGPRQVGRYQIAYTVGSIIVVMLSVVAQAWAPRIFAIEDRCARWAVIARVRDETYRLLLPVVGGLSVVAPMALAIVAPSSFAPSSLAPIVFIVALSALPVSATLSSTRALVSMRRARPVAVASASAAVLNVALNVLLVPVLGIAGSALATVLAFGFQALLQWRAVRAVAPFRRVPLELACAMAATTALAGCSLLLPSGGGWAALRWLAGAGCLAWLARPVLRARLAGTGT